MYIYRGILKHTLFFEYLHILSLICGRNSGVILQNSPHWADIEMKKLGKKVKKIIDFRKKKFGRKKTLFLKKKTVSYGKNPYHTESP